MGYAWHYSVLNNSLHVHGLTNHCVYLGIFIYNQVLIIDYMHSIMSLCVTIHVCIIIHSVPDNRYTVCNDVIRRVVVH